MKKWLIGLASGIALAWALSLAPTPQTAIAGLQGAFDAVVALSATGRTVVWVGSAAVAVLAFVAVLIWWTTVGRETAYGDLSPWFAAAQVAGCAVLFGAGVHLTAGRNPLGVALLAAVAALVVRRANRLYRVFMHPLA